MKIYKYTENGNEIHPAGSRIEAEVIVVDGGYKLTPFRFPGARTSGCWELMTGKYKTLGRLLLAAERSGFFVDTESANIK